MGRVQHQIGLLVIVASHPGQLLTISSCQPAWPSGVSIRRVGLVAAPLARLVPPDVIARGAFHERMEIVGGEFGCSFFATLVLHVGINCRFKRNLAGSLAHAVGLHGASGYGRSSFAPAFCRRGFGIDNRSRCEAMGRENLSRRLIRGSLKSRHAFSSGRAVVSSAGSGWAAATLAIPAGMAPRIGKSAEISMTVGVIAASVWGAPGDEFVLVGCVCGSSFLAHL